MPYIYIYIYIYILARDFTGTSIIIPGIGETLLVLKASMHKVHQFLKFYQQLTQHKK